MLLCSNGRFESSARKQPQPEDDLQLQELQQGVREAASETHACAVVVCKLSNYLHIISRGGVDAFGICAFDG